MRSKPSSRLAQTPSSSNLTPKLKSKLDALQGKYNEFMSNCATLFEEDSKPKSFSKISPARILKKRESHNEFFKESEKLRRKNTFLSKVVNDLSDKVSNLESQNSESLVLKNFEDKLESKKKLLEQQEQEMVTLQKELEKTRIELNLINRQHRESKALKCQTPVLQSSVTRSVLRLSKPKDFTPMNRNRSGSPISRSISPKERINHQNKVKINELQSKLQKTIEERDLYKTWKDYCSKHPAVPPAITSIISHYEIELRKATSINSIFKSKIVTLEKVLKETIFDVEKMLKVKRTKQVEDIVNRLKDKMRENESESIKKIDFNGISRVGSIDSEILRLYSNRYEKENKDLEDILRRENLIADLYSEAFKAKSEEVDNLRNTFSTLYSYDKNGANSTYKPAESLSEGFSAVGTPFGKNFSLELSFAQKIDSPKMFDSIKSHEKVFDDLLNYIENSLVLKINLMQGALEKLMSFSSKCKEKVQIIRQEKEEINRKVEQMGNFERIMEKNKILIEKNEELEIKVRESEKIIEGNEEENRKFQGKVRGLEMEKQEILGLYENLGLEKEKGDREIEQLIGIVKRLNGDIAKDSNEMQDKAKLVEEIKFLERKCADYEGAIKKAEKTILELQDKSEVMKNYRNEYLDIKEELESFKSKVSILQDFHRENQKIADEKNNEISSLIDTLQEKNKTIENLYKDQVEFLEIKQKHEKLVLASNKNLQIIQTLTDELNKKSSELLKTQQDNQESHIKCLELQKEVKRIIDIKESIEKELNKTTKSLHDSNIYTNELESKLNFKTEKYKECKLKIKNTENQFLTDCNELKKLEDEKEKKIEKLKESLKSKDSLINEMKKTLQDFETLKGEKDKIEQLLNENSENIQNFNKDLENKLSIIETLKNEKVELIGKVNNLEENLELKIREIENSKREKMDLIERLDSFKEEILLNEQKIKKEKEENIELTQKLINLTESLENKSNELENERKEKLEFSQKLINLTEILENKSNELENERKEKLEFSQKLKNLTEILEDKSNELEKEKKEKQEFFGKMMSMDKNLERKFNELEKEKREKQEIIQKLTALEKDFKIKLTELERGIKEKQEVIEKSGNFEKELEKILKENELLCKEKDEIEKKLISLEDYEKNQSNKAEGKNLKSNKKNSIILELEEKLEKVIRENEDLLVDFENQKQMNLSQSDKIESLNLLLILKDEEIIKIKSEISETQNHKKLITEFSITTYEIAISPETSKINQHNSNNHDIITLSESSFEISINAIPSPLKSYFLQELEIPLSQSSITKLKETIQSFSKNQKLFEAAYKRLESDFQSFKSSSQDKHDDLKLENYELSKLTDDLKKRLHSQSEEARQLNSELSQKDSKILFIQSEKTDLEASISRLSQELAEKSKKILELTQEITNTSNYIQKILKEKESAEREIENLTRSSSLDHSQIRSEVSNLRAQYTKLDSINSSLEQAKANLEIKMKKLMSEKSEVLERQEEMTEEIEGLKQIRTQQSEAIQKLEAVNKALLAEGENDKKTINEYKNKLATYMRNTSALEKELRSMTPPPRKTPAEDSKENSPSRICHTADSLPQASLERTLEKLKKFVRKPAPEVLLSFCKEILNQENFSVRLADQSMISDDSKVSDISSVSEVNVQEGNYRAHAKMIQLQQKNKELVARLMEKKNRVKRFKDHIKGLQEEFRRLDSEAKSQKNFDVEHFKSIFQKFLVTLKNLDPESMKILQVLAAVLGVSVETLNRSDSKSRWNPFSKKNK